MPLELPPNARTQTTLALPPHPSPVHLVSLCILRRAELAEHLQRLAHQLLAHDLEHLVLLESLAGPEKTNGEEWGVRVVRDMWSSLSLPQTNQEKKNAIAAQRAKALTR